MLFRFNAWLIARLDIQLSAMWFKVTFCCVLSTISFSSHADVVISEFMASNDSTIFDEDGDDSDWIELHNTGTSSVSINGWYLTDDDGELTKWQIPNVTLNANEYLLVFASDKERDNPNSELHTNFKLSSGGEYLALIEADGSTVASEYSPEYPQQFEDISFGPDGYFTQPTPGSANGSGVSGFVDPVEFDLEHGFFSSPQTLSLSSNISDSIIRYSLDGSLPSTEIGCDAPADGNAWSYQYYENNGSAWTSMPNFGQLTPVTSSTSNTISTDVRERDNNFGLVFNGCVQALEDGYYLFETTSDDGSQLFVNDILIVDNVSSGSTSTLDNEIFLAKGLHEVRVSYYQATGNNELSSQWAAPRRGQTVVLTPDEGVIYPASNQSNNFVEFEFDLPSDGTYRFDAVVQGFDTDSDTFWVQLNDQSFVELNTGVGAFQTVVALSGNLDAGEHTLKIYPREDGAILDAIVIVGTNCEGPCETQYIEAENQSVSGVYVYAGLNPEEIHAEKWFTYTAPISIDETTIIRANAVKENFVSSETVTQSYFFLDDVILQSPNEETPPNWIEVTGTQDMDYGMDPEIVNPDPEAIKNSLASLPTISLVTDIDNLLHPSFGIYVNAQQKGRDWERPASIELIDDTNAEEGFTIDAGIRIRGGFSRTASNPRHPFRVFFRNQYDGDLDYPLFGEDGTDEFEKIDFRAPNNYSWSFQGGSVNGTKNTLLREVWSRDTQAALGLPHTRSRYYHLYINGQYWGVHMTQERISKEYAESYFGGDEDDYDVVKHNRQDGFQFEASDGTTEAWSELWDLVSDQIVTPAEYEVLDAQVDLENLIDYVVTNGYEGDLDGSTSWFLRDPTNTIRWARANNWFAIRDRESGDLKWTFFQHDGEHSLGVYPNSTAMLAIENTLGPHAPFDGNSNGFFSQNYLNPYWLHEALRSNSDYRQRAIDRTAVLFADDGVLSTAKALERWNQREAQVTDAILAQSARWGDSKRAIPYDINDWLTEVTNVENSFFPGRSETVFAQLVALGLASDVELTLSIPTETEVEVGTVVTITSNFDGTIYYTLDGSDPREPGGEPSANAIELVNGEIEINSDLELTFRVQLADGSWSPIQTANYTVLDNESCFVVKAKNGNVVVFCL